MKKYIKRAIIVVMTLLMIINITNISNAKVKPQDYAIASVMATKIMFGSNSGFNGNQKVTRAQAATVIVRVEGVCFEELEKKDKEPCPFSDVKNCYWAKAYINEASALGLITGVGENKFKPDKSISVVEFIAMITRVLGYDNYAKTLGSDWKEQYMNFAREKGILNNLTQGQDEVMTRNSMAIVVSNALKVVMTDDVNGISLTLIEKKLKRKVYNQVILESKNDSNCTAIFNSNESNISVSLDFTDVKNEYEKLKIGFKYDIWCSYDGKVKKVLIED